MNECLKNSDADSKTDISHIVKENSTDNVTFISNNIKVEKSSVSVYEKTNKSKYSVGLSNKSCKINYSKRP